MSTMHAAPHTRPGFAAVFTDDFRRTFPLVGVFTGAAILLGGLVGLFGRFVPVLAPLGVALAVMGAGALIFGIQIFLAVRFYISMVGREAPITRAWPVTGVALFIGKLISGMLNSLIAASGAVAAVLLGVFIAVPFGPDEMNELAEGLQEAWAASPGFILGLFAWVIVGLLASLVMYFFSILVGSRGWLGKLGVGGPLIVGFLLWIVIYQFLGFLSALIPVSYNVETNSVEFVSVFIEIFQTNGDTDFPYIPLGMPLMYVVTCVAMVAYCLWDSSRTRDIQ